METYLADLHIHSRYSRATSKSLDPETLAAWAAVKGIQVVGTGDFTHPGWLEMLEKDLVQGEDGLLRLRENKDLAPLVPGYEHKLISKTRFMLSAEISSIYKQSGVVRKIHNLIFFPGFEPVKRFNQKLERIGNIKADGRPIIGLDSRSLLEMVLDTDFRGFIIPAHIWTPWFSLFGSKSGFDSLEECFGDLSGHIFALETGLSSDPEMNWLWSRLDRFSLVSNSDAHSADKLGREANIFQGESSYFGIYQALRREGLGQKFLGTLEFYPEEGKYHLDGHRRCGVVMDPKQTIAHKGKCPVCGKDITVGVLNRILAVADREAPQKPDCQPGFSSVIPLKEILSEFLGVGPKAKKVHVFYNKLIRKFGTEMHILQSVPVSELDRFYPPLAMGVERMRSGEVIRSPGFDGQYGEIRVFTKKERQELKLGKHLMPLSGKNKPEACLRICQELPAPSEDVGRDMSEHHNFNDRQREAIGYGPGPVLVLAGPGTGKTQTLMGRVSRLLADGVNSRHILVLTYTRKAAQELKDRLAHLHGPDKALPKTETLHAMAYEYWQRVYGEQPLILNEQEAFKVFSDANPELSAQALKKDWQELMKAREELKEISSYGQNYAQQKQNWNLVDFIDLLELWLEEMRSGKFIKPFTHVLVDEVQDLSMLQLLLVKELLPRAGQGFFGIGDPRQSIYGFRGACRDVSSTLDLFWPELKMIVFADNYRSDQDILDFSQGLFPAASRLTGQKKLSSGIILFSAANSIQEAHWVGQKIRALLGGTAHWQKDAEIYDKFVLAPEDIAILVRFKTLAPGLERELQRMGIPVSVPQQEPYYRDSRVDLILRTAARVLGVSMDENALECPDKVLAHGPQSVAAYLGDMPPFDQFFWQSKAFKDLKKEYRIHEGWVGLINHIRLESELDQAELCGRKVRILTMHAAKGLEFEAVFLPCLEDGVIPFAGSDFLVGKSGVLEHKDDVDEEERLFYVSLTRAKRYLFLSRAKSRKIYGRTVNLQQSRFLSRLCMDKVQMIFSRTRKVQKEKVLKLF